MSKAYAAWRKRYLVRPRLPRRARWVPPAWVVGVVMLVCVASWGVAGERRTETAGDRLQRVVDRMRQRFALDVLVDVEVVAENPLVASVRPDRTRHGVYLLSMQQGFLEGLTDEELEAIVAHELGHVWIYTHHPYLQTEQLANRIALRHVTRAQLAQVYEKVWGVQGVTGELSTFLGVRDASAPR